MSESLVPPPLPTDRFASFEDKGPWGFWATFGLGAAIFVAFATIQFVVTMVMVFVYFGGDGSAHIFKNMETLVLDGRILSLSMAVSFPILILGAIVFAILRKGISIREYLAFRPMAIGWWISLPPLTALLVLFLGQLLSLAGAPSDNEWMLLVGEASVGYPFVWIGIVLLAPVAEEIFFRGFLHAGWAKTRLRLWGTILLTSIGWTIIHSQYDLYGLAFIFILGLVLGFVRWKTNSIYGPILVHMVNNAFAMAIVAQAVEVGMGS